MKAIIILLLFLILALRGIGQNDHAAGKTQENKIQVGLINHPDNDITENIVDDLLAMNIIRNKTNVAFALTADELRVNDEKQPDEVLQKIKEKYKITPGTVITYARAGETISVSTVRE